jgi:hypothetical protein
MTHEEIVLMRYELNSTSHLVDFIVTNQLPLSQPALVYMIERVRYLRKTLADAEANLLREITRQVKSN